MAAATLAPMRSRAETTDQALLLRRIPFRESSLVLHLLTRDHGRIALLARGARRPSSRMRPHLTLLAPLSLRWVEARCSGMGTLTAVARGRELLPPSHHLAGLELLALAARLFHEGDGHGFAECHRSLALLGGFVLPEAGWIAAALELLHRAGWIDTLDRCWRCGSPADRLFWSAGGCRCGTCLAGARGREIGQELRRPLAAREFRWDDATLAQGREIVRTLVRRLVEG